MTYDSDKPCDGCGSSEQPTMEYEALGDAERHGDPPEWFQYYMCRLCDDEQGTNL